MSTTTKSTGFSRTKLTRRYVENAISSHVRGARSRHWDSEFPMFYLQITPGGHPSYCLRYTKLGGQKADYTIGSARVLTPEMAREDAKTKMAKLSLGGPDPVDVRRENRERARNNKKNTFEALCENFLTQTENKITQKELYLRKYNLSHHINPALGKDRPAEITKKQVKAALRSIQESIAKDGKNFGYRTANACHTLVKLIFNWAIDEEVELVDGTTLEANPARFKKLFDDLPETRYERLNGRRLKALFKALEEHAEDHSNAQMVDAIKLFLFTLQRPIEIIRAQRGSFDLENRTWTIGRRETKTGDDYFIPLSSPAMLLVERILARHDEDFLFPSTAEHRNHITTERMGAVFRTVREKLLANGDWPKSPNIQLYDIRRFGRTIMEDKLGVSEFISERVLNHAPERGMKRRYFVARHQDKVRAALEAWGTEVMTMLR